MTLTRFGKEMNKNFIVKLKTDTKFMKEFASNRIPVLNGTK